MNTLRTGDLTALLQEVEAGRPGALDELLERTLGPICDISGAQLRRHLGPEAWKYIVRESDIAMHVVARVARQCKQPQNTRAFRARVSMFAEQAIRAAVQWQRRIKRRPVRRPESDRQIVTWRDPLEELEILEDYADVISSLRAEDELLAEVFTRRAILRDKPEAIRRALGLSLNEEKALWTKAKRRAMDSPLKRFVNGR